MAIFSPQLHIEIEIKHYVNTSPNNTNISRNFHMNEHTNSIYPAELKSFLPSFCIERIVVFGAASLLE
jgi:hypothetical protein